MKKIGVILVHNKSTQENFDQIEALKALIQYEGQIKIGIDEESGQMLTVAGYTFTGLNIPHQLIIRQIVPNDKDLPLNSNDVNNGGITRYDEGGETDKIGDHPAFFNWSLKRATDLGADLVCVIDDISTFDPNDLIECINDTKGKCILDTFSWGQIAHNHLQILFDRETSVLNEEVTKDQALDELTSDIEAVGLETKDG